MVTVPVEDVRAPGLTTRGLLDRTGSCELLLGGHFGGPQRLRAGGQAEEKLGATTPLSTKQESVQAGPELR